MAQIRSSVAGGSGAVPTTTMRLDQRLETADISGRDERFDLGARGGDQQDEVFGEVDGPAERVPRTLAPPASPPPAAGVLHGCEKMAGDPAVLQR